MQGFFDKKNYEDSSIKYSCTSCGLFKHCKTPKMKPVGQFKKKILIVGEMPSSSDDQQGGLFLDRNGRFLKKNLSKIGIDLFEDCLVTSALRCSSKKIPKQSILSCRRFLISEIKRHEPKVIILLGQLALESLIGSLWKKELGSVEKWHGFTIPDQTYNAWICPIYAPNFVLNSEPEVSTIWQQDLQKIKRILNKKVLVQKEPEIEYIEDLSVLNTIKGGSKVSFDYETTGIKPHAKGHRILCVSIADSADHVWTFELPKKRREQKPFLDFLQSLTIDKMAHNMKFEDNWTNVRLKVPVRNWKFDTQLAAHQIDNRPGITSLKFQTYVRLGIADYDSHLEPYIKADSANGFNKFAELMQTPDGKKDVLTYCGYDSIYQYRIAEQMIKEMDYYFLPF
ncbi:MAG: uracil-DNA glycosylase family protein [Bacteroidales bacterium]